MFTYSDKLVRLNVLALQKLSSRQKDHDIKRSKIKNRWKAQEKKLVSGDCVHK